MTKHQARMAFSMIYIPTITYNFAACSFTLQQAEKIQAKAIEHFLPAMGWRRTSARAFVHGPLEFGGINLPHLYAIQGAQKMITLINNMRGKTSLGYLLINNINWLQLISGKVIQLLLETEKNSYIQSDWILNLQEYMHMRYITLTSELFWTPKLQRINDELLMEAAVKQLYTPKVLRTINNWRMFFQAIRLLDICDGYGKQILEPYIIHDKIDKWS